MNAECRCTKCDCTDSQACEIGCYWLIVDRKAGIGVCSNCPEAAKPVRVQLSRATGFRLPPNTVSVARPSRWGNPFVVGSLRRLPDPDHELGTFRKITPEIAVNLHRQWMEERIAQHPGLMAVELAKIRGKSLACWCPVGSPCHADALLELANRAVSQ